MQAQTTSVHTGFNSRMCALQVSVAEERHRGLKEALEVDVASIGSQADRIKVRNT